MSDSKVLLKLSCEKSSSHGFFKTWLCRYKYPIVGCTYIALGPLTRKVHSGVVLLWEAS